MSAVAPDLFQRRFGDLVAIGRARLRPLAPEWTDHNAHDPGITLMELLAWVAEAQLYSVSRVRRDERAAYAALVGLVSAGTAGAEGLIWPDHTDPNAPVATFAHSAVIAVDAGVHITNDDQFEFRPTQKLLWVPGRITKLAARNAAGRSTDFTAQNARGRVPFLPFGEGNGTRRTFSMTFACRDDAGPFGRDRQRLAGALWSIGVMAAPPSGGAAAAPVNSTHGGSSLSAAIVTGGTRVPVAIAFDSTQGLMTTGVLLLNLDGVTITQSEFTLELRSATGFARPPRLLRVEPNVIPVRQGRVVDRELAVASGRPNWSVDLARPGLRFAAGEEPVVVQVAEGGVESTWRRGVLEESGPDDRVYEMDPAGGTITFGNGFNGRIPLSGAQVFTTYSVSDGARGNVGRNRKWMVTGFAGTFGINPDPFSGGRDPLDWIAARREARRRTRDEHALVSQADFIAAAEALPLLEVARGWMVAPGPIAPRTGVVTLVVMRSRPEDTEPAAAPETRRWLEEIRRRLLPRVPLGMRLEVVAPRYAEFTIRATLECAVGRDPNTVRADVEAALRRRLALVTMADGTAPRQPGVPVSRRDVTAWLRAVDGVRRVATLELVDANGETAAEIGPRADGLPRWNAVGSSIGVARPAPGVAR